MTAQNVSCCSSRFRMLAGSLLVAGALLFANESASAQSYVLPPEQTYPAYGPSGSAVATQVDYDGRGMGVLWRAGHSTGETVGREESVSFITGTPFITMGENMFFGDLRLLRSNSGGKGDATGIAYSFGAGYRRYFADVDAVFGINAYIDNDELIDRFQAWGVGAELLSHNWEWRGNMYRPFGDTGFQTNVRAADGSARFAGDALLFDRIRTFSVAMEGYDTEIGVLLPGRFAAERQIRLFGGGYYYRNDSDDPIGW